MFKLHVHIPFDFIINGFSFVVHSVLAVSLWDFILFMWDQNYVLTKHIESDTEKWTLQYCLLFDVSLLSLFMLVHSITPKLVKQIMPLQFQRLIYVLISSVTLEVLLCYWIKIPEIVFWKIDIINNTLGRWIFVSITALCLLATYTECLTMDVAELVGLKQSYYYVTRMGSPLINKTERLQEFFQHMRHPGFTSVTALLWCHPLMTLDRFAMALVFTLYMLICFPVTKEDYFYQKNQMKSKFVELKGHT